MDSDAPVTSLNLNLRVILGSFKFGWGQEEYIRLWPSLFAKRIVMGLEKALFLEEHVLRINRCIMEWYFQEGTYIESITSAVKRSKFHNVSYVLRFSISSFHIQVLRPRLWIRLCGCAFVSIWWQYGGAMCWTCALRKKQPFPISSQKTTNHITNLFNKKPLKTH